jgi:hypothetical protein
MRIGILSDTHLTRADYHDPALAWAMEMLSGVDAILHAGDVGDLDWLMHVAFPGIPFFAVAGNCDPEFGDARMPTQRIEAFGRWRIGLAHGWGAPTGVIDRVATLFGGGEVHAVIFGHTHAPHLEKRDGVVYFNPGSLLVPRDGRPSIGLLTERGGKLQFEHLIR